MKRNNPDEETARSQTPCCVGGISSFFCPPASIARAPLSSGEIFRHSELDKLSPKEQEQVFRDLYGLDSAVRMEEEEDHSIISKKLDEFELQLKSIISKEAYEEAVRLCPAYVEKTRLMFLRADRFNAQKAARRFVKHWQTKLELFGSDKAFSGSINQSDLTEADLESLASGGFQILSEKDRGGRTVFWSRRQFYRFQAGENLVSGM
jgi:hypothetical protein